MTTASDSAANGVGADFGPLVEFWTKWVEQSAEQTQALLGCFKETADPAALRRLWLDSLAQSLDVSMRTPAFLEAVRRNYEMVTQMKGTAEDLARDFSRSTGIPRISDISGLFERLRIGQEMILARLGAIEERLEALESKRKRNHAGS
jgi:hypothetical protein